MSDISFDAKLKVVARAFFRDNFGDSDYPHQSWQEQYDEFVATNVSEGFVETCYQWNKEDPELNPEVNENLS